MTTKKERIVFYVDGKVKDELGKLAKLENRSLSNWLKNLTLNEIQSQGVKSQQPMKNASHLNVAKNILK